MCTSCPALGATTPAISESCAQYLEVEVDVVVVVVMVVVKEDQVILSHRNRQV